MNPSPERSDPADAGFDRRVYWLVLAVAAVFVLGLYWFTAAFNIPLGAAGR